MRIGILGGTFDPIHNGHIRLAEGCRRRLKLDKVVFVPANIPPHKPRQGLLSAKERYKMVLMAVEDYPYFDVSDCEISRGGTSYSVKTLQAFRREFPKGAKLFFLAGADSLLQLDTWKDLGKIVRLADFVAASRPGYKIANPGRIKTISIPTLNISSTMIRRQIKKGFGVKRFLPKGVYAYINKKGLYK